MGQMVTSGFELGQIGGHYQDPHSILLKTLNFQKNVPKIRIFGTYISKFLFFRIYLTTR